MIFFGNMYNQGSGSGFFNGGMMGSPFPLIDTDHEGHQLKMPHDTYEVYVNKEFVGHKMLLAANEDIYDVENFLQERGFYRFTTDLTGNRFTIKSNDPFQRKKMKENLSVYLQIR